MAASMGDTDSALGATRLHGRGRKGAGRGDGDGGWGAKKAGKREQSMAMYGVWGKEK